MEKTLKWCLETLEITVDLSNYSFKNRQQIIQTAYLKQMKKEHPDVSKQGYAYATKKTTDINNARDELRIYYGSEYKKQANSNEQNSQNSGTRQKEKSQEEREREQREKNQREQERRAREQREQEENERQKEEWARREQQRKEQERRDQEKWAREEKIENIIDGFKKIFKVGAVAGLVGVASFGAYKVYDYYKNNPVQNDTPDTTEQNTEENIFEAQFNEAVENISTLPEYENIISNNFNGMSDSEKVDLFNRFSDKLAESLNVNKIDIVTLDTDVEVENKLKEWEELIESKSSESYDRNYYISRESEYGQKKLQYTLLTLMDIFEAYTEEYYKQNINAGVIGSLSDNLLMNEHVDFENNYITINARMRTAQVFAEITPEINLWVGIYTEYALISALDNIASGFDFNQDIGGNKTLSLDELIELDFSKKLQSVNIEKDYFETNQSIYYSNLTNIKNVVENIFFKGEVKNIRYTDLVSGRVINQLQTENVDFYDELEYNYNSFEYYLGLLAADEWVEEYDYILASTISHYDMARRYFADDYTDLQLLEMFKFINEYIDYISEENIIEFGLEEVKKEMHDYRAKNLKSSLNEDEEIGK